MMVVEGEDLSGATALGGGGLITGGGEEFLVAPFATDPTDRLMDRLSGVGERSAEGFMDTTRGRLGVAKDGLDAVERARDALTLIP